MLAMICLVMSSFIFLLLGSFLRSLDALSRLSLISLAHLEMSWAEALVSSLAFLMALMALSMVASFLALSASSSSMW